MKKLAIALLSLFGLLYGEDFYGDEISTYKGDYYQNESFWNRTFLENSKECDDIRAPYIRFSSAKDRTLYFGYKTERAYKIFQIWTGKGRVYDTKAIILWAIDAKKYKHSNDDEYIKNVVVDERVELVIDKEGSITIMTMGDYENFDDDTPTYLYVCPTK